MTKKESWSMEDLEHQFYTFLNPTQVELKSAFIKWLLNEYDVRMKSHIVDMGCGPGSMLVALNNLGYKVTGYEPNQSYFEAAKQLENTEIEIIKGGFLDIKEVDTYGAIIAINGPYSYLQSINERKRAIELSYKAVKKGGVLFLDNPNFPWILKHYREPLETKFHIDGIEATRNPIHEIDFHQCTWIHTDHFSFIKDYDTHEISTKHHLAMIQLPEIYAHLNAIGFKNIKTFNSYESRVDEPINNSRMMVAAQK